MPATEVARRQPFSRAYYSDTLSTFLARTTEEVLGALLNGSRTVSGEQGPTWREQVGILRGALAAYRDEPGAKVYFEWAVPRVGKRIDVVAVIRHVVFVIEFKVGESAHIASAHDQVWDYALDLKNFHETSHHALVAPILVATEAPSTVGFRLAFTAHDDRLYCPIFTNAADLSRALAAVLADSDGPLIDADNWEHGRYSPTPTIIEAALALYGGHGVGDISRSDAAAVNLSRTSGAINEIIRTSRERSVKAICFVTGVPGAGKTLVGLKVATDHSRPEDKLHSTFLSGNQPLVSVMTEALARDKYHRDKRAGRPATLGEARRAVAAFIQIVHRFRDEYLRDKERPPVDHVVIFDEAQRAWNHAQTAFFMRRKKGVPNFTQSEPEFLISCLDRHKDWAVIVCLVGGGQEINTGEVGIAEWIDSILRSFQGWEIHISPKLRDSEYAAEETLKKVEGRAGVSLNLDLHLSVSMRSFRAESVSSLVKAILDHDERRARQLHSEVIAHYPIVLTRDLRKAKAWLKEQARGSERYGVLVSSEAQRLKPHAIDVRSPMDPVHWFLGPKEDVRSSYYLEDVATQFHVQGLELDWAAVVWDGDFRAAGDGWSHHSFVGDRWQNINKEDRKLFLKNAYRVLLTRARQGMVIVVPEGDPSDPTRSPEFYDQTYRYLGGLGLRAFEHNRC
jgi:hypothetical protein